MKKKFMAFMRIFGNDKLTVQYQKVEDALKEKAEMASDVEFHRTMRAFYDARAKAINPHEEWWAFADAKQKEYDHKCSTEKYLKKLDEAAAKLSAREAALKVLLEEKN